MPYFIELFFANHGSTYPFIAYQNVADAFLRSTLSPLLSTLIAALAAPCVRGHEILSYCLLIDRTFARYSNTVPELAGLDPVTAAEYYLLQAKVRLSYHMLDVLPLLSNMPDTDYVARVGHGGVF
jgi:hypothetical protein